MDKPNCWLHELILPASLTLTLNPTYVSSDLAPIDVILLECFFVL